MVKNDHEPLALAFTRHAEMRIGQRGIRTDVIETVLDNFDRDVHAGAGVTALSVSRHRCQDMREQGYPVATIDQVERTVLLISDLGELVTAINRETWHARFHRGARRLNPRRRTRCRHGRR